MSAPPTPAWLKALGAEPPPPEVRSEREHLVLVSVLKHDFFAFTGLYETPGGERRVVKIGRRASVLGCPLGWLGRWLAGHERRLFGTLDDLPLVPRFTGMVGRDGITHEYVPGRVLRRGRRVPDGFFEELAHGLGAIHARDVAYVDLEKGENVLLGDDGRPYLFDFQISLRFGAGPLARWRPLRWFLRRLQEADRYHARKLQRLHRPDQLSEVELRASYKKPWLVGLHGKSVRPFQRLRRRLLDRIDPAPRRGERGAVPQPSDLEARGTGGG